MKPPLNAATSVAAWAGWIGAVYRYGPPPGLFDPEYSRAASRWASIHAIPAGYLPPGGTSVVWYTTRTPPTARPAGAQVPSPAAVGLPNGASAAGAGSGPPVRWPAPVVVPVRRAVARWRPLGDGAVAEPEAWAGASAVGVPWPHEASAMPITASGSRHARARQAAALHSRILMKHSMPSQDERIVKGAPTGP